jgi:hypothetical protein
MYKYFLLLLLLVLYFFITPSAIFAQTITPVPRCSFACVDGSGNSSYTVGCSSSACGVQAGAVAYCSSLGNGNTFQSLSCCQDRCAGAFFQSPPGCYEATPENPKYGCRLYKEKIACNNACADGAAILVPTPSERNCTTNPVDYCGTPAEKCFEDKCCEETQIVWENTCEINGGTGQVNGIVRGRCGPTETTCGNSKTVYATCDGNLPATGSCPSINNPPSYSSYIGVNSPVSCTITQTAGNTRVNSSTFGNSCAGISSAATPVTFHVSCSSGPIGADNRAWRHTIVHNNGIGSIATENATSSSGQVNYNVNFAIKYIDSGVGVEGTDNISVQVCDGGSNYQTPWSNQAQYNLPEYCQTVNATIQVDTRPPYLGLDISIKDAKTVSTKFTASDTNLVSHSYFCTKVGFTKVPSDQFDKIYTPNSTTTCTNVNSEGVDAKPFVDNPILMTQSVNTRDERVIDYSFKEDVKNQIEPFRLTFEDKTNGWNAFDSFCNSYVASTSIPPLGYQDLRNGKSLDVGSPWLQTKGGKVYSQNGVNYTLNDIDANTCKVTDNSGNELLTQIDGVTYKCPEANDDYTSTFYFTSLAATNSPRASKYGEILFKSNLGKITNIDKWSGGTSSTVYDYFKRTILRNANFYKSNLKGNSVCASSGIRKVYRTNAPANISGSGDLVSNLLTQNSFERMVFDDSANYVQLSGLGNCDLGDKAIFIEGNLNIEKPTSVWNVNSNTVIMVSGDVFINPDIRKTANNSLLIIAKGNIEILGGNYASNGKTPNDYPGYDVLDLGMVTDAKITTSKDAPGPVWDALLINGMVFATGMCPNDRGYPLYQDGLLSSLIRVGHSGKCESKFGRDLLLLQNFVAPSESIVYDPSILTNLASIIGYRPKYDITEIYDPRE